MQRLYFSSADELASGITKQRKNPNLVVIRAGNQSRHKHWKMRSGKYQRDWDLCLSFYGDDSSMESNPFDFAIKQNGSKYHPLYVLFNKGVFTGYDYIWFPDDDLDLSYKAVSRLFSIAREYNLAIAQPALSLDSFFSHAVTRWDKESKLRFTNYVEVMCPVFSQEALQNCAETFANAKSAWGIDHAWYKLLGSPKDKLAIIDDVIVKHMRPIGQNYDMAAARAECDFNFQKYAVDPTILQFSRVKQPLVSRLFRKLITS